MFTTDRPWNEQPLVCFDLETTSVDSATCEPVSVAAVRFEAGEEVSSFYSLLRTEAPIPAESTAIHGITDEHVRGAPSLAEVAHELFLVAEGAIPVGFNTAYDKPILHRYVAGTDCPLFDPTHLWLCVLIIVRDLDRYVSGKGRHKLETCCTRWGVALDGAHNALADARATGRLLWCLFERGKIRNYPAHELLTLVEQRRVVQDANFQAYLAKLERQANAAPPAEQLDLLTGTEAK